MTASTHADAQTPSRFRLTPEQIESIRRDPPRNLTIPEGAAYSTLSPRFFQEEILQGRIRSVKIGGRRIIRLQDLEAYLAKRAC